MRANSTSNRPSPQAEPGFIDAQLQLRHIRWFFGGYYRDPGFRDWLAAGAFEQIHQAVLARARAARLVEFDRVMVDGSHVRRKRGAPQSFVGTPTALDHRNRMRPLTCSRRW
ncbi:hypothetical protein ACFROC_04975 [Nocardia tengchongensis]|uniref:hypothetical protein n=1 Tax=Nocardia tengchongensis TaxID=2055889 RepID=UPI0036D11E23